MASQKRPLSERTGCEKGSFLFVFSVGDGTQDSCMLRKCSATSVHPQPTMAIFSIGDRVKPAEPGTSFAVFPGQHGDTGFEVQDWEVFIVKQIICFSQFLLGLVLSIYFTNENDLGDHLIQ